MTEKPTPAAEWRNLVEGFVATFTEWDSVLNSLGAETGPILAAHKQAYCFFSLMVDRARVAGIEVGKPVVHFPDKKEMRQSP